MYGVVVEGIGITMGGVEKTNRIVFQASFKDIKVLAGNQILAAPVGREVGGNELVVVAPNILLVNGIECGIYGGIEVCACE